MAKFHRGHRPGITTHAEGISVPQLGIGKTTRGLIAEMQRICDSPDEGATNMSRTYRGAERAERHNGHRHAVMARPQAAPRRAASDATRPRTNDAPLGERVGFGTGRVQWFEIDKGYGFIGPSAGGKDIFVHISALRRANIPVLLEGQLVSYDIYLNNGKVSAENISVD